MTMHHLIEFTIVDGGRCLYSGKFKEYTFVSISSPGPEYHPFEIISLTGSLNCAAMCTAACACEIYHLDEMGEICSLLAHVINVAEPTGNEQRSHERYDSGQWMEKTVGEYGHLLYEDLCLNDHITYRISVICTILLDKNN